MEVFWIRLVDRPREEPEKRAIVPDWTCGSSQCGAFKKKVVFQIGLVDRPRVEL